MKDIQIGGTHYKDMHDIPNIKYIAGTKIKDVSGERYNSIRIISYYGKKNKKTMWKCQCDCGNEFISEYSTIKRKRPDGCSKCRNSVINVRFNYLTAIKRYNKDGYGRWNWLFKCDCGKFIVASLYNVKSGNTKSCGCLKNAPIKRIDLTGKIFGNFTVLSYYKTINGKAYWTCTNKNGDIQYKNSISLTHKRGNLWAKNIKKIYGNFCYKCGSCNNIHVHHIYPVNMYKLKEKDLCNGIVLCKKCHKELHSIYGHKKCSNLSIVEYLGLNKEVGLIIELLNFHRQKNGKEDLLKAKQYIDFLIEAEYE